MASDKRLLGITIMGPYLRYEGVDAVLENVIERSGATVVACNTSVVAPGTVGEGSHQPPIDAGASPRLFDRPQWGKTRLWLRSGPGHRANERLFVDSPYPPREPNDLTESQGPVIGQFIDAAKRAGLQVIVQTSATQPPGLREVDIPRLPDGRVPPDRMAHTDPASHGSGRPSRY